MMYQQDKKVKIFNEICETILNLAIVNFYWFVFSLLGGVIFGIGPSTIAIFSLIRKWLRGEKNFSIFKEYWNYFKSNFIKGNIITFLITFSIVALIICLRYYQTVNNLLGNILTLFVFLLMLLCFIITIYIFPVYVNYDVNLKKTLSNSIIIATINPVQTILMLVAVVLIYTIGINIPGLLFFFGISTLSYSLSWLAHKAFNNMEILNGGNIE